MSIDYKEYKATHKVGRPTSTKMVQGKVFKEGSKGSRKVQMTDPEKQDRSVRSGIANKSSRYSKYYINSRIVGAPETPDRVPFAVRELMAKKKKEKLKAAKQQQQQEATTKPQQEALKTATVVEITAPDNSKHKVVLSEVYPV